MFELFQRFLFSSNLKLFIDLQGLIIVRLEHKCLFPCCWSRSCEVQTKHCNHVDLLSCSSIHRSQVLWGWITNFSSLCQSKLCEVQRKYYVHNIWFPPCLKLLKFYNPPNFLAMAPLKPPPNFKFHTFFFHICSLSPSYGSPLEAFFKPGKYSTFEKGRENLCLKTHLSSSL